MGIAVAILVAMAAVAMAQAKDSVVPSRCAKGQDGSSLCLRGLRSVGGRVEAELILLDAKQQVQPIQHISLQVDGIHAALVGIHNGLLDASVPTRFMVVMPSVWSKNYAQVMPQMYQGLGMLLDALAFRPGNIIELIGHGGENSPLNSMSDLRVPMAIRGGDRDRQLLDFMPVAKDVLLDRLEEAMIRLNSESGPSQRHVLVIGNGTGRKLARAQIIPNLLQRANRLHVIFSFIIINPENQELIESVSRLAVGSGGTVRRPASSDFAQAISQLAAELEFQTRATFQFPPTSKQQLSGTPQHDVIIHVADIWLRGIFDIDWAKGHSETAALDVAKPLPQAASAPHWHTNSLHLLLLVVLGFLAVAGGGRLLRYAVGNRVLRQRSQPIEKGETPLGRPVNGRRSAHQAGIAPFLSQKAGVPSVVRWLFDIEGQRTYVIPHLPVSIGTDLDCDIVLHGLDYGVIVGTMREDGEYVTLHPSRGTQVIFKQQATDRPIPLPDRAEFTFANRRLVLFETVLI